MDDIKQKLEEFIKTKKVDDDGVGLCRNCKLFYISNIYDIFDSWEYFSGNYEYPIQSITKDFNAKWEYNNISKYSRIHLKFRLSLAKHILDEINEWEM